MTVRLVALSLAAVAIAGCDASAPTAPAVAAPQLASSKPLASATGSGQFYDVRPTGEGWRNFEFTARTGADGTTGEWQLVSRATDTKYHGTVTCLSVVGNQAWFTGMVTDATDPAFVGKPAFWRVVDNGEGANAPADQITYTFIVPVGSPPELDCTTHPILQPPAPGLFDIQAGNVQVH